MHGKSLSKNKSIFHELANQTLSKLKNNSVAFEVILCLSRTRTDIRPRELNRKISFYNCKQKLDKKMNGQGISVSMPDFRRVPHFRKNMLIEQLHQNVSPDKGYKGFQVYEDQEVHIEISKSLKSRN
nr:unnamed protein product [Callosobruchus chinensis]